MRPFFGLLKKMKNVTTTSKVGQAMINAISINQGLKLLENKDINDLSEK